MRSDDAPASEDHAGRNEGDVVSEGASMNVATGVAKLSMERDKRRVALQKQNLKTWQDGPQVPSGTLDSNMKRNTGFIKRVRQGLGMDAKPQLLKEASTLNLDKYVEELAQAIPEGLLKCSLAKDCLAAAEIVSALHARFPPTAFAYPLTVALTAALAPPNRNALQAMPQDQREREETNRVSRQKVLMRAAAELALTQVLRVAPSATTVRQSDVIQCGHFGAEWLYQVMRDLLATDREHANVPILITLLKGLGSQLFEPLSDSLPAEGDKAENKDAFNAAEQEHTLILLDSATSSKFQRLCETYFTTLSKKIVSEHQKLQEQDKRNHEAYIKSGDIFEDRQQRYEKMAKSFEKAKENGKALSDLLGLPMPELTDVSRAHEGTRLGVNLDARSATVGERSDEDFATGKSPWEDEDTRRFYEDIIDLADMVPVSILGFHRSNGPKESNLDIPSSSGAVITEEAPMRCDADAMAEEKQSPILMPVSPIASNSGEHLTDEQRQTGSGAQVGALLARLPDQANRSMIDSAAIDFAFLNSKPARRRLVKQLLAIPRSRTDLIPYYARLVATLTPYMPDIGKAIIDALDEEFRYLQRKRMVDLSETRAKNARFIAELTKFKVTPLHIIFHCFKVCLDDFSGANIEVLATLLETCGRYLLRTEATIERMRSLLEMLRRKRAVQNLDNRQLLLLDNAYYQCNPPERKLAETKKRSMQELYIRHLIYDVLNRQTFDKVLKLLRKLPWSDPEVVTVLSEVFIRVWRLKFSNIYLLALLLADLQPHHSDFVIAVIDAVCEETRLGMEQNLFKYNQRRTAMVQYLAELYIYRLINSALVFDQLWSLVTFGHPDGRPLPGQVSSLDAPDDFFRLRLICTVLDTCGPCFNKGSLRKRLDEYLAFLNLYVLSKEQPLPKDVDFMLYDTLEAIRPTFELKRDWSQAAQKFDDIMVFHRVGHSVQAVTAEAMSGQAGATDRAGGDDDDDDEDDEDESEDNDQDGDAEGHEEDEDGESASGDEEDATTPSRGPRGRSGCGRSSDLAARSDEERESDESSASRENESSDSGGGSDDDEDDEEDEDEDEDHDDDGASLPDDDDPVVSRRSQQTEEEREAEAEFERELAKMMAETTTSGSGSGGLAPRHQQRSLFEQGLPFIKKGSRSATTGNGVDEKVREGEMRFELLSKRGNKHQAHTLHLPSNSAIAMMTREKKLQEQQERRQLKEYVLGYEGREDADERHGLEHSLARRGHRVREPSNAGRL